MMEVMTIQEHHLEVPTLNMGNLYDYNSELEEGSNPSSHDFSAQDPVQPEIDQIEKNIMELTSSNKSWQKNSPRTEKNCILRPFILPHLFRISRFCETNGVSVASRAMISRIVESLRRSPYAPALREPKSRLVSCKSL